MPPKGKIIPYLKPPDWSTKLWKSYYKTMRERLIRGDGLLAPDEYRNQVEQKGSIRFGKPSCRPDWCPPIIYRRWLARNAYNRAHKKPEIYLHEMDGINRTYLDSKNSRIMERNGISEGT